MDTVRRQQLGEIIRLSREMLETARQLEWDKVAELEDIGMRETIILMMLAIAVLLFGLWPAPLLDVMHPTIEHLFEHVIQPKLG